MARLGRWWADGFLGYFSLWVTDTFLEGWSSFPSTFLLGAPFPITFGADKDAPSFPFSFSSFLCAEADALTNALCLATSIFVKDKWQELDTKTTRKRHKEIGNKGKTYANESKYSTYVLQASALNHHNRRAAYQG